MILADAHLTLDAQWFIDLVRILVIAAAGIDMVLLLPVGGRRRTLYQEAWLFRILFLLMAAIIGTEMNRFGKDMGYWRLPLFAVATYGLLWWLIHYIRFCKPGGPSHDSAQNSASASDRRGPV